MDFGDESLNITTGRSNYRKMMTSDDFGGKMGFIFLVRDGKG